MDSKVTLSIDFGYKNIGLALVKNEDGANIPLFAGTLLYDPNQLSTKVEPRAQIRRIRRTRKTKKYRLKHLANIAKHSKADRVILSLRKTNAAIELGIEDNGQGFEVEELLATESYKRGLGLSSMRERAELSGGSFIHSVIINCA